MNVLIIQTGEPVHIDTGGLRPMRAMNLSDALVERGHDVHLVTTDFSHQEKRHRRVKGGRIEISEGLTISFLPSPGYKRNIGLMRILDHFFLGFELKRLLKRVAVKPDIVFVGFPPIETAHVAVRFFSALNIPVVLDVKDKWPELFIEPFPRGFKGLAKIFLSPYFLMTAIAFSRSSALVAPSEEYLSWAAGVAGRSVLDLDRVAPLTSASTEKLIRRYDIKSVKTWLSESGVDVSHRRRVMFAGTFMSVFDFRPFKPVFDRLYQLYPDFQLVLCGDGDYKSSVVDTFSGCGYAIFTGWAPYQFVSALSEISSFALLPYKNISNYRDNVPNKAVDSLSFGLPVLTSVGGAIERVILSQGLGILHTGTDESDVELVVEKIRGLFEDEVEFLRLRALAQSLYERDYSSQVVYSDLVNWLEVVCGQ